MLCLGRPLSYARDALDHRRVNRPSVKSGRSAYLLLGVISRDESNEDVSIYRAHRAPARTAGFPLSVQRVLDLQESGAPGLMPFDLQPVTGLPHLENYHSSTDSGASFREISGKSCLLLFGVHFIIVSVDPMREAEMLRQHPRAHKGRRYKARRLGKRGDGGVGLVENKAIHVAQAVDRWIRPSHDAGVRRNGQRRLHCGVRESNAARRQCIKVRSLGMPRGIAAQVVGAGRVKSDEQNVCVARRWCRSL